MCGVNSDEKAVQFSDAQLLPYVVYFTMVYMSWVVAIALVALAAHLLKLAVPGFLKIDQPILLIAPTAQTARRFHQRTSRRPNRHEYWRLVFSTLVVSLAIQWVLPMTYFFRNDVHMSSYVLQFMLIQVVASFALIALGLAARPKAKRTTVIPSETTP